MIERNRKYRVEKDGKTHGNIRLYLEDSVEEMADAIQAALGIIQPFHVNTQDTVGRERAGYDAFDIIDFDTGKVWVSLVEDS